MNKEEFINRLIVTIEQSKKEYKGEGNHNLPKMEELEKKSLQKFFKKINNEELER